MGSTCELNGSTVSLPTALPCARKDGRFLYVMQAEDGRIKIGRSKHPHKRCRDLQSEAGLRIWVCLTLRGRGWEESRIHAACSEHRALGEWFVNTEASMDAIMLAVGQHVEFKITKPGRLPLSDEQERRDADAAKAVKELVEWIKAHPSKRRRKKRTDVQINPTADFCGTKNDDARGGFVMTGLILWALVAIQSCLIISVGLVIAATGGDLVSFHASAWWASWLYHVLAGDQSSDRSRPTPCLTR